MRDGVFYNQEIFKIRVPLHSSGENPPLLVYNHSRSIYFQLDMTDGLKDLIAGKAKIYVLGYIDHNQIFQIINKVEDQRW